MAGNVLGYFGKPAQTLVLEAFRSEPGKQIFRCNEHAFFRPVQTEKQKMSDHCPDATHELFASAQVPPRRPIGGARAVAIREKEIPDESDEPGQDAFDHPLPALATIGSRLLRA